MIYNFYKFVVFLLSIQLYIADEFVKIDENSKLRWAPHDINLKCPLFVFARNGNAGLGDQLEHFIYTLNVAKLFGATIATDGLKEGPGHHSGNKDYADVGKLLGINSMLSIEYVEKNFQQITSKDVKLNKITMSFPQALQTLKDIENGQNALKCNTAIETDIYSCDGIWCLLKYPEHKFLKEVIWVLRNNTAREKCMQMKIHKQTKKYRTVNVVWHLRTGDVCIRCGLNNINYYYKLTDIIQRALGLTSSDIGHRMNLMFESQEAIPHIEKSFPNATILIKAPLVHSVCNFLTADIFVSSGSSLSTVAAFTPPFSPLVFEERRKDSPDPKSKDRQHHLFTKEEAILLEDGVPVVSDVETISWIRSVLSLKNKLFLSSNSNINNKNETDNNSTSTFKIVDLN